MADYEFATEEVIGTGRLTWQQINQANQHHEFILKVSQLPLTNFIRLLSLAVEHVGQLSILVRGHVTPLKGGMLVHKKRKDMAIYLAHIIYIEIPMLMGDGDRIARQSAKLAFQIDELKKLLTEES